MEIENVTAVLKQHVYEQGLDQNEPEIQNGEDAPSDLRGHTPAWEKAPQLPWIAREPFSPPTMGYPLPYLDVMTIQSKRLLPVTRKELDAQRRQTFAPQSGLVRGHSRELDPECLDGDEDAAEIQGRQDTRDNIDNADAHSLSVSTAMPPSLNSADAAPLVFDAILRSVRLLVEPIAIPDLSHTGVKWQLAKSDHAAREGKPQQLCVTVPNHSFDETQVKLFYPSGAKNTNMREYIKDTIQKHMTGLLTKSSESDDYAQRSPTKHSLAGSHSMPVLQGTDGDGSSIMANNGPINSKTKKKHKFKGEKSSPTKLSLSPQKRAGISSGARLSGSVSTSGLLNPELTRQAKDVLAQLRANANKANDLIG